MPTGSNLPGTEIPIQCFKCYRPLTVTEIKPNPFPSPVVKETDEYVWKAYSFKCDLCGTMGQYQYKVDKENEE